MVGWGIAGAVMAGTIKDMNSLLVQAKDYGATFSVHMNKSAAYPEPQAISDTFIKAPPDKTMTPRS